jgi:hypothetical protein
MLILPTASQILLNAIIPGSGTNGTRLNIAYLEFTNGTEDITPPDTMNMADYYRLLADSTSRDYVRCPVSAHKVITRGNGSAALELIIVSDQEAGINGKPFNAEAGSRVYGFALGASTTPDHDDLLFCVHYFEPGNYADKPTGSNIVLTMTIEI